jgi:hypothetical protein
MEVEFSQAVAFRSFVASNTILGTSKDLEVSHMTDGSTPTTWDMWVKMSRRESPVPVPTLKTPDTGFTVAT